MCGNAIVIHWSFRCILCVANAIVIHWSFHWTRILVQVTINRRRLIGRVGHLDQSEAYDLS